jgi:hypothetical protein
VTAARGRRRLLPFLAPALLLLAAGSITVGVVLLSREGSEEDSGPEPPRPPARGRLTPADVGLPAPEGAYAFESIAQEKAEAKFWPGSVAFRLKEGDSSSVQAFYYARLAEAGWRLSSRSRVTQDVDVAPAAPKVTVRGTRCLWTHPLDGRRLSVLALDYPQKAGRVQVMLNWAPARR